MSKKLIIITAAAGLISFAGAFIVGWLTKPSPPSRPDELSQPTLAGAEAELELLEPEVGTMDTVVAPSGTMKKAMTERQLKTLVYEVREKVREYNNKLQGLEVREQRLQVAHDVLNKDIEDLNNLRIELASIIASLKEERDNLLKSRIEITNTEKANMVSIAAAYDKMEVTSAGKILNSMCMGQMQDGEVDSGGSSFDEAAKILHYMTERTKAKLLAELATSEPKLAAALSRRLKQIIEGK
ncbi:MAG: hypothetical protein ACYTBX_14575 [Planctomycetota bacterium]